MEKCANFPSNYLGLVTPEGGLEFYDGKLRFKDIDGKTLEDQRDPGDYLSIISEATEQWSYLKFPFYRPLGYPNGAYRVGPLGRLNVIDRIEAPIAQAEFQEFKSVNGGRPITGSLYYHYARLIEGLFSLERAQELLRDPDITGAELIAAPAGGLNPRGVGVVEAPRGTLFHDYQVDENGRLTNVNLIVSTPTSPTRSTCTCSRRRSACSSAGSPPRAGYPPRRAPRAWAPSVWRSSPGVSSSPPSPARSAAGVSAPAPASSAASRVHRAR